MTRLVALAAIVAAVILIASPAARTALQRNLISVLVYGGTAVAVLLVATGRIHWLVAAGWAVLAILRRLLPWIGQLPWLAKLWQRWRGTNTARGAAGRSQGGNSQRNTDHSGRQRMSPAEARETLGVGPDAGTKEIAEAHRRLMQRLHPDRGGSAGLASRLNEAREVLLNDDHGQRGGSGA